jgi:hypothetical protein
MVIALLVNVTTFGDVHVSIKTLLNLVADVLIDINHRRGEVA